MRIPVKIVIDGYCSGELVVINEKISFYGEVDPEKGIHKPTGKLISDKVMLFPGTRGSTVGSYIIYALKKYGRAPKCIVVEKIEPILVAGCVIGEIPLFKLNVSFIDILKIVSDGLRVVHNIGEEWFIVEK